MMFDNMNAQIFQGLLTTGEKEDCNISTNYPEF
jgi:hypothetical protein